MRSNRDIRVVVLIRHFDFVPSNTTKKQSCSPAMIYTGRCNRQKNVLNCKLYQNDIWFSVICGAFVDVRFRELKHNNDANTQYELSGNIHRISN